MQKRQQGMIEQHSRAGKAHDGLYPFFHPCLKTMDFTRSARRFLLLMRAFENANRSVLVNLKALRTKRFAALVFAGAIDLNHRLHSLIFSFQPTNPLHYLISSFA